MKPTDNTPGSVSIVIPAKNEAESLGKLLPAVNALSCDEVIVVDDGSTDGSAEVATANGAKVIRHPYSIGNGGAIKSGARAARGEILVFMDADSQHDPSDIERLLSRLQDDYDMVVGARDRGSQANSGRAVANRFYNWFASRIVGQSVLDLTSGFRVARRARFREFLLMLPNGFSYPTTITMCFFRAGYRVGYVPITAQPRIGKSHIRLVRDGVRFLLIIFRVGALYSPLKVFVPSAAAVFLAGLARYVYTYVTFGRFTNMSALLLSTAVVIFLLGLVSEQITMLTYQNANSSENDTHDE
ncbi:MAG: glycosyltransferase family 2 protein [Rhodothermales bacterium]